MLKPATLITPLFLSILLSCEGAVVFRQVDHHNITKTFPSFRGTPWDTPAFASQISATNAIKLVNIDEPHGTTYNPCDVNTITASALNGFAPAGQPWIGVIEYSKVAKNCNGITPLYFYYGINCVRTGQLLGAAGVIVVSGSSKTEFAVVTSTDVRSRTVGGTVITIPMVATPDTAEQVAVLATPDKWELVEMSADNNEYTSLQNIFGFYRILATIEGVWTGCLYLYNLYGIRNVLVYFDYGRDPKTRKQLNLRMLILLSEVIGGIARILFSIDPVGFFFVEDFILSRAMLNLSLTLTVFSNIITIFFCYDVYRLFEKSRTMQKTESLTTKYPWIEPAIIGLAFLLVIADTTINLLALNGKGGANSTTIPALYQLVVNLSVIFITLRLNCLSLREIGLMKAKIEEKVKSTSKGASSSSEFLKRTLEKFNRTRVFMMRAALGVTCCVLALLLIASGIVYFSPLSYGLVIHLSLFGLNLIMTFQVLAASELPETDTRKKKEGTSTVVSSVNSVGSTSEGHSVTSTSTAEKHSSIKRLAPGVDV